jgi:DNA-binding NarL/FixJ family response regulator
VTTRVLVVDDQELLRNSFCILIDAQPDMSVVGEAADGARAVAVAAETGPDVVVMDIRMPVMDGLEATRLITGGEAGPGPRVLILTTFDLDEYVFQALRAGASGFALKSRPLEELLAAIRVVAAGEALLAPSVTRRLVERFAREPHAFEEVPPRLADLTPRELEVLRAIARGLSNTQIAQNLCLSVPTVKTHIGRLLAKLGARDRAQLVIAAYESGLVKPR